MFANSGIFIILALAVGFFVAFASTPTVIVLAKKIKDMDSLEQAVIEAFVLAETKYGRSSQCDG